VLHLHRLEHCQLVAPGDAGTGLDQYLEQQAMHRRDHGAAAAGILHRAEAGQVGDGQRPVGQRQIKGTVIVIIDCFDGPAGHAQFRIVGSQAQQQDLDLVFTRDHPILAWSVDMDVDGLGSLALGILYHGFQPAGVRPVEHLRIDIERQPVRRLLPQLVVDDGGNRVGAECMVSEINAVFTVIFGDEGGGRLAPDEVRFVQRIDQEIAVGLRTEQGGFGQGLDHPPPRLVAGGAMGDDLGDHRIVEGRNLAPAFDAAINPRQVRRLPQVDRAGARQEIIRRIFGIEPDFHRMTGERDVLLLETQ